MSAYDRLLTRHAQDDDDELFVEAIFGDPDLLDALEERGKLEVRHRLSCGSQVEGADHEDSCYEPIYVPTSGAGEVDE